MTAPTTPDEQAVVTWTCEVDEPDYLDGIKSGVTIRGVGGRPVAYAFKADEGRLLAAAPDLLAVVREFQEAFGPWKAQTAKQERAFALARAALAKALGEPARGGE